MTLIIIMMMKRGNSESLSVIQHCRSQIDDIDMRCMRMATVLKLNGIDDGGAMHCNGKLYIRLEASLSSSWYCSSSSSSSTSCCCCCLILTTPSLPQCVCTLLYVSKTIAMDRYHSIVWPMHWKPLKNHREQWLPTKTHCKTIGANGWWSYWKPINYINKTIDHSIVLKD